VGQDWSGGGGGPPRYLLSSETKVLYSFTTHSHTHTHTHTHTEGYKIIHRLDNKMWNASQKLHSDGNSEARELVSDAIKILPLGSTDLLVWKSPTFPACTRNVNRCYFSISISGLKCRILITSNHAWKGIAICIFRIKTFFFFFYLDGLGSLACSHSEIILKLWTL
jgi:hypothetical protein